MHIKVSYPEVVLNIRDIKTAIDTGDKVGEVLEKAIDELDANISIKTAAESGIARREKILNIKPLDSASLEDRRLEVLLRWYTSPVYTERTLRQKLDAVLGVGQYVLNIDTDNKMIECKIELTRRLMFDAVAELLEQMIPLDYLIDVTLRYNQHKSLMIYTHGQLKSYTHDQLRNEPMLSNRKRG